MKKLEEQFRTDPLNFEIDSTTFKVHDVAVLLKQFSDRYKNLDLTVASFLSYKDKQVLFALPDRR